MDEQELRTASAAPDQLILKRRLEPPGVQAAALEDGTQEDELRRSDPQQDVSLQKTRLASPAAPSAAALGDDPSQEALTPTDRQADVSLTKTRLSPPASAQSSLQGLSDLDEDELEDTDSEQDDEELERRPVSLALSRVIGRAVDLPVLGQLDAAFANDNVSPDYRHLGEPGTSQAFTLTAAHLDALCRLNHFDLSPGRDEVLVGLRGCQVSESAAPNGWMRAVALIETLPDHVNNRCLLGVWKRSTGQMAFFPGSTVPNWKYMEANRQGRQKANLLPTGRYMYKVGTHRPNKKGAVPGAFRQEGRVVVLRTYDDLIYTINDEWSAGRVSDNIHPGRRSRKSRPPYFSSAGCQTVAGDYKEKRHTDEWAAFRRLAGISPDSPRNENGRRFVYVLFTGREARLAASLLDTSGLARLRYGSSGDTVRALQSGLQSAGVYQSAIDGDFGTETCLALIRWQQGRENGSADGIVTPQAASALGFQLI